MKLGPWIKKVFINFENHFKENRKTLAMIKEAFSIGPTTSVANETNLCGGAHIMYTSYRLYLWSHHALVTEIDKTQNQFKIIHFTRGSLRTWRKAVVREETHNKKEETVLVVNNNFEDFVIPGCKRLPFEVSIAVARYFKENENAVKKYKLLTNNCEHFAFTCSSGYAVSFQEKKWIRIFYECIKRANLENFIGDMLIPFEDKKVVEYTEGQPKFNLKLHSDKKVTVHLNDILSI